MINKLSGLNQLEEKHLNDEISCGGSVSPSSLAEGAEAPQLKPIGDGLVGQLVLGMLLLSLKQPLPVGFAI